MKVFIPAAGKGTRLGNLTKNKPKALVEINEQPMLHHLIIKLKEFGFDEFVINIHHHGDQVIEHLRKHNNYNVNITIADECDELLNTGGGLVNASKHFSTPGPFLVHNVDILTDLDLKEFYQNHQNSGNDISLLVNQRDTSRYLLFDDNMRLGGWENRKTGEQILNSDQKCDKAYAFGGIHVVNQEAAQKLIPESGEKVFPIIPEYIRTCKELRIVGIEKPEIFWLDMGRPEHLIAASEYLMKTKSFAVKTSEDEPTTNNNDNNNLKP